MEILGLIVIAICSMMAGATIITVIATIMLSKQAMPKRESGLSTKMESVSSRMRRVKEITTEQLDIQGATSGPQKNSMHGRYKNGLISRMKELEEQKTEILRSIVADGFDPLITIMDGSGSVTNVKLSEFLAQTGVTVPQKGTKPPPKTSKFVVLKGGKDDSGNTTH